MSILICKHTLMNTLEQTYPPEDWLATNALVSDFDAEVISAFAHELQPQHVRFVLQPHQVYVRSSLLASN